MSQFVTVYPWVKKLINFVMFLSLSILKNKNYMFSFFDTSIISSIEENKKIKF